MQLLNIVAWITLLVTTAVAQRVTIGSPADGTNVTVGSNINVVINRPPDLSSSQDVSVAIGLQSCPTRACFAPNDTMGTILTFGPYAPNLSLQPPSQTYTVTIPDTTRKGHAQLDVAHFALIGASRQPFMETLNITLNIV